MPPRPAIKTREGRPISAIYIGANPNGGGSTGSHITHAPHSSSSSAYLANGASPALPDLPEPPSPDSSVGSRGSGLPSPPATNSTGSGSTGDPGSIALRQRPLSFASDSSASTSGSSHRTLSEHTAMPSTPGRLQDDGFSNHDDDRHDDHDLDGDDTAKLDRRHHPKSSSENVLALQRVKNLTQRNRMAIDKLTRLGSPSPSNPGSRSTGSPVPSHTSSSTSSKLRQTRTALLPNASVSGSETERESESMHTHSSHSCSSSSPASSSRRPITPPPPPENNTVALANTTSPYSRLRHISAPESPQKARLLNAASGSSNSSVSPTNRRRKRASMASMAAIRAYENDEEEDEEDGNGRASRFSTATGPVRDRGDTVRDVTQSALAAVASSRRSPVGTRRRGALPREFRDGSDAVDARSVTSEARKNDDSPNRKRLTIEPVTPYRGSHRSSTLRETSHSGGASTARWASEDYRNTAMGSGGEPKRERRQTLRGGSAESALWSPGGRTLIGEGLRAAGMSFRRDEVRTLGPSSATADVFRERERLIDWSPQDLEDKGKRRVFTPARELATRAATSMADYRSLDRREVDRRESALVRREEEEADRSRALRNHRSTYSLSTARERGSSTIQRNRELSLTRTERDQLELDRMSQPPSATITQPSTAATVVPKHLQDRHSTASPFGSKRMSQTPVPGATSAADHVRLMLECLASFEGNVSKLPSTAVTNLSKIPSPADLMKHAQNVVYTTERINALMRHGSNRALEEQISAEVDGEETARSQDMLDVWRRVGGEYREGLRASDELVRALTSFIMDVGSTLRKLSPSSGSEYGSPVVHARSISLDEEGIRQQQQLRSAVSPDLTGRRSVGSSSRKSWDPAMRDREREREETLRKLGGGAARESPPGFARASPALSAIRDRDRNVYGTPSPASTAKNPLPPLNPNRAMPSPNLSGSVRRLFTPSQQREHQLDGQMERPGSSLRPSDSQKTLQGNEVEPSPTAGARTRTRTLPPAPLPRPLPILASEQSRRTPVSQPTNTNSNSNTTSSTSVERSSTSSRDRRKASVTSIVTIRGSQAPSFPGLTTPSTATTGVTAHTVSNSPEQTPSILRSISSKSTRSTVTFSRPTNLSVSVALSGIQQQAREDERKRVGASNDAPASANSDASQSLSQPRLEVQQQPKRLAAIALAKAQSGPEAERDLSRRNTTQGLGASPSPRIMRMSLDGSALPENDGTGTPFGKGSTAHAADRHAASTVLPRVGKERRRTVTDIWPRD